MNPLRFLIRGFLAVVVLWFIFSDFGLVTRISMELENRQLEKSVAADQQRIEAQSRTIRNVYQPDSVEKAAREHYNFRRKGETVFIIAE